MKLTDLYRLTSSSVQISNDDILLISDYTQNNVQSKAINIKQLKDSFKDTYIYKTNNYINQELNLSSTNLILYKDQQVLYIDQFNDLVIQNKNHNILLRTNDSVDVGITQNGILAAKRIVVGQQPTNDHDVVNKAYTDRIFNNVLIYKGSVATSGDLPLTGNTGYVYYVQDDSSQYIFINAWQKIGTARNQYFQQQLNQKQNMINALSTQLRIASGLVQQLSGKFVRVIAQLSGQFDNYLRLN